MTPINQTIYRAIWNGELHEFAVTVDFDKLDPALLMKSIISKQSKATASYGALVVKHVRKIEQKKGKRA